RLALAWLRLGAVPHPFAGRQVERLAACRAGGRGSARHRECGNACNARVANRQPVLDRTLESDRLPPPRSRASPTRVLRSQSGGAHPVATGVDGRLAADSLALRLGG